MGKTFNPAYHEAVMQQEVEEAEDDTVIDELQKGYFLNDKVLRPARVVVAKKKTAGDIAGRENDS